MNIVSSLIGFLKTDKKRDDQNAPEGLCPNCWGRQEYGGNFYEAVKNHGLDVNSKYPEIGWIKDYAETHLKGIALHRDGDKFTCESCKISYRVEE